MKKPGSNPADYADMDAYSSIRSIKEIIGTGILSSEGSQSPFFRPCITQILIELSDLLQKSANRGNRISFKDDISPVNGKERDVTDLINDCRNAACHISSGNHIFEQNKFTFNVMVGYCPNAFKINDVTIGSDYHDDIAIMWGGLKLYAGRHILRAYQEAVPHFPDPWSRS
ncbi:hypothetical protein ACFFV8_13360 [Sphingobium indicum]|uniref:hypothetical protein n=1 Tax=Sphingobium TaxID=165695 RepID=UPI001267B578|nr:hypothetical protein [Sphingobium sp. HDIP04]